MELCQICQNIDFANVTGKTIRTDHSFHPLFPSVPKDAFFAYEIARGSGKYPDDESLVIYHKNIESLQKSALFCSLCRLVQKQVDIFLGNVELARTLDYAYPTDYEMWVCGMNYGDGFQVLGHTENSQRNDMDHVEYQLLAAIGFCVDESSELRNIIRKRKVSPNPRATSVLQSIDDWIRINTAKENRITSSTMPTRVLRIEDNAQRVILQDSIGANDKYACLSHCWGSGQQFTLNAHTMARLYSGISTYEVPKTFQDAIWFTNQMNLKYLWIDSLCIIQDDIEDWTHESSEMDKVYRNSTLTIAASLSSNSSEGFLDNRLEKLYVPIPFSTDNIHDIVFAFGVPIKHAETPHRIGDMEEQPLMDRGWTLQERYMSSRTIHFTSSQILLEFKGKLLSEDSGFVSNIAGGSIFFLGQMIEQRFETTWRDIVQRYSRRILTKESDKLPALSGLAAYLSANFLALHTVADKDNSISRKYLAGIWSTELVSNLCWATAHRSGPGIRPAKYRAPTWSWASIDGAIDFHTHQQELVMLKEADIELKNPQNPFGEVTAGWIYLQGIKLTPQDAHIGNNCLEFFEDGVDFYMFPDWDARAHDMAGQPIEPSLNDAESDLVVVPLVMLPTLGKRAIPGPFFLLLKAVQHRVQKYADKATYQRVGSGIGIERNSESGGIIEMFTRKWTTGIERGALGDIIMI